MMTFKEKNRRDYLGKKVFNVLCAFPYKYNSNEEVMAKFDLDYNAFFLCCAGYVSQDKDKINKLRQAMVLRDNIKKIYDDYHIYNGLDGMLNSYEYSSYTVESINASIALYNYSHMQTSYKVDEIQFYKAVFFIQLFKNCKQEELYGEMWKNGIILDKLICFKKNYTKISKNEDFINFIDYLISNYEFLQKDYYGELKNNNNAQICERHYLKYKGAISKFMDSSLPIDRYLSLNDISKNGFYKALEYASKYDNGFYSKFLKKNEDNIEMFNKKKKTFIHYAINRVPVSLDRDLFSIINSDSQNKKDDVLNCYYNNIDSQGEKRDLELLDYFILFSDYKYGFRRFYDVCLNNNEKCIFFKESFIKFKQYGISAETMGWNTIMNTFVSLNGISISLELKKTIYDFLNDADISINYITFYNLIKKYIKLDKECEEEKKFKL